MPASTRYPQPSELQRSSIASQIIVDTKTVILNSRNSQGSETIDTRCVNVTRKAKAASEDGTTHTVAKRRRNDAGPHRQRLITRSDARPALTKYLPKHRPAVMSVGLHTVLHLVENKAKLAASRKSVSHGRARRDCWTYGGKCPFVESGLARNEPQAVEQSETNTNRSVCINDGMTRTTGIIDLIAVRACKR